MELVGAGRESAFGGEAAAAAIWRARLVVTESRVSAFAPYPILGTAKPLADKICTPLRRSHFRGVFSIPQTFF
jgi:hypothetical protein